MKVFSVTGCPCEEGQEFTILILLVSDLSHNSSSSCSATTEFPTRLMTLGHKFGELHLAFVQIKEG